MAVAVDHLSQTARANLAGLVLVMFAIGVVRHFGWEVAPPGVRGVLSKGLGAVQAVALILLAVHLIQHEAMRMVAAWWLVEESLTAACSFWWMASPWPVAPGQAMCSARAGFDLGSVSIVWVAVILWRLTTRVCSPGGIDGARKW